MLVFVLDTLSEVGLGRSLLADLSRDLAALLLGGAVYDDGICIGNVKLYVVALFKYYVVGITKLQSKGLSGLLCSVAYAVDNKLFGVSLGNAHYHVVDKCAGEAVDRSHFFLIVGAGNGYGVSVLIDGHSGVESLAQGTLCLLDTSRFV